MIYNEVDWEKFALADFSLHAGSNPLALGRFPCSPSWPGLTSKTGLGLEREHQKRTFRGRFLWPGGPRGLKTAPGTSLDGSHSVPRGLQTAPRAFQEAPRELQEACTRPQERSERPQEASKSTSRGFQTLPEVSGPLGEHTKRLQR